MENEATERTAVTRGQNAMYVLPHDAAAPDEFLAGALQRLDVAAGGLQLLVVASDAEAVAAMAGAALRLTPDDALCVVPVTSARRAERRVREGAHVVIGTASDLLSLVRSSTLKLDDVRAVVIAWADELASGDTEPLEALFAEVPRTAARTLVATVASEAVEALVERHARRPRRNTAGDSAAAGAPVNVAFLTTAPAGRGAAVRRVIDALDPETARVHARDDDSARMVQQALTAMGYRGTDAGVTLARDADISGGSDATDAAEAVDLVVMVDLPATHDVLAKIAKSAKRCVVLVQPRQVASLRRLARGGVVTPVSLPENAARGAQEVAALRNALREELAAGGIGRELLVLEPLLDEHDPMELAAAALRLAGRTRTPAQAGPGALAATAAASQGPTGPMTRIFINVGEMDNARPADLVGAIINEGGAQRDQVGRIDVRDKHAVVEVEAGIADQVIERLTGTAIRGRRVQARVDQERPVRSERPDRGDRPSRPSRDAGDRPHRSRSFDRDRPPARSFDRERPPARSFDRERPPARPFERGDRTARPFDRTRPPARSFDRPERGGPGERPSRPPRDRDDRDDRGGSAGSRSSVSDRGAGTRGPGRPPRPRPGDS